MLADGTGRHLLALAVMAALPPCLLLAAFALPTFRLKGIEVRGTGGRVADSWVRERLQDLRGANTLLLSSGEVARRVGDHPWVGELAVHKLLPDRLEVEVREKEAVLASLEPGGEGGVYVGADGEEIAPVEPEGPAAGFPRLLGTPGTRPEPARAVLVWRVASREAPELDLEPTLVHFGVDSYCLRIRGLDPPVAVSSRGIEAQLRSLRGLLPYLQAQFGGRLEVVDLRFEGQAVVRRAREGEDAAGAGSSACARKQEPSGR